VQTLVEALSTAVSEGHKALVFSQWTSLLDLIETPLKGAGIAFERLDGSTPNRGEVTARFQGADGAPVMLMSLKAGGTGLNLTAADHVFLMDPWWNPQVEAQAADRAHRIGQERPVMVYRLVAQGTVEERILGLQEKKRALFEAALSEAAAATAITREDLLELFS
jgi:SNF2 family DNA or RNA helicase